MNKFMSVFLAILFLLPRSVFGEGSKASPELVVHLLDYLAKDYGGAVQNGKVISKFEYDEQVEFAAIIGKNAQGVENLKNDFIFSSEVKSLQNVIAAKGSAEDVARLARKLQQDAIRLAEIDVAPRTIPDLELGSKLYQAQCIACHGNTGFGDGPAGKGLDPKPANFHDPDLVLNSAPFKYFNTIRLGVPGTGMAAFSNLTDEEVWALAFYLKALPVKDLSFKGVAATVTLKDAATLTDQELINRLGDSQETRESISKLRSIGTNSQNRDPLETAKEFLLESVHAAKANDYTKANDLALRAYLEGVEPIEPKMKANLPGFVEELEGLMSAYRASIERKDDPLKLDAQRSEIAGKLNEVKRLFSESKMSSGVAFGAAFSIFLREGFEAILIIVILISVLRAMNQPKAIQWVHIGWATAVLVGLLTWFASGLLLSMSGLSRELMEGAISLVAVAVLVYVGFWLHRYSEMKRWRAFLESKLKAGLSQRSYFALAVVAFMAVFREAFEVVLFLRAIWIDLDASGHSSVGLGVLASIALLAVLSYLAVKQSKKLPLGLLFQICSWTMMALAVILAGKGLHSFQEAGAVGVTPVQIPLQVDLLGIYPSLQTLSLQIILVLVFAILLFKDLRSEKTN